VVQVALNTSPCFHIIHRITECWGLEGTSVGLPPVYFNENIGAEVSDFFLAKP